jgi:hypothetical protein
MSIWRDRTTASGCSIQELEQVVDMLVAKMNLQIVRVTRIEHGDAAKIHMELMGRDEKVVEMEEK